VRVDLTKNNIKTLMKNSLLLIYLFLLTAVAVAVKAQNEINITKTYLNQNSVKELLP
jgi:hypothetical protein